MRMIGILVPNAVDVGEIHGIRPEHVVHAVDDEALNSITLPIRACRHIEQRLTIDDGRRVPVHIEVGEIAKLVLVIPTADPRTRREVEPRRVVADSHSGGREAAIAISNDGQSDRLARSSLHLGTNHAVQCLVEQSIALRRRDTVRGSRVGIR